VKYFKMFPVQVDPNLPPVNPESIREKMRYWQQRYAKRKNPGGLSSRV
jgi:hypothetical protein